MYRVFNMGIGLILVAPASAAQTVIARATALGDPAWQIGTIVSSAGDAPLVEYVD
jgi:phosphoribosylformylglycinamidine cyclo-ligase